jgi:hypothetical protein
MEAMGEWTYFRSHRLYKQNQGTKRSTRRCSNGRISAHTGRINKTRVPKEAQDDALSNGTTGDRQTSTGRPTRGDVVRMTVLSLWSGRNSGTGASLIFWRENIFVFNFLGRALSRVDLLSRQTNDRFGGPQFPKFIHSRHVKFLRAPHMNRHKNLGPKGLLRSFSLPTRRSFSPSFHTSTHKQFHL